jgi:drug/metabolite transporter (DMT)-like permease
MGLCILIGFGVVTFSGELPQLVPGWKALGIYALSGISTSVFVVTWLIAVRTSAYVLMNVFLMLGVIVPMCLGSLCYGEAICWNHWAGLGVLLIATLLLCSYNNGIKQKLTGKGFLVLLLSGIANGITSFSQKMLKYEVPGGSAAVFNFYTYVFSAASLGLVLLVYRRSAEEKAQPSPIPSIMGYLVVMAISLFLNSFFLTKANSIPSAILYPLERGVSMILSGLMAALLFKEKMTVKAIVGLILAFIGLLIINML